MALKLSIFAEMTALARRCGALNLSQGFPDFEPPAGLRQLICDYLNRGGYNQYAPMEGVPELRRAIARKIERFYGVEVDPDREVTVVAGATQGIFTAVVALASAGGNVLLFEPAYDSYLPAVRAAGATPVPVPLRPPHFTIDWDLTERLLPSSLDLIIVNSPHNPATSMLSSEDIHRLAQLAEAYDAVVVSDEVYEHITFDGRRHVPLFTHPVLRERTVCVYSFGKVFHSTGWKVGYVVAGEELTLRFRNLHQFVVFSVNTPVQYAIAEFMEGEESWFGGLPAFFEGLRDFVVEELGDSPFSVIKPQGTYFLLLDYGQLSRQKDREVAVRLTREHGVALIPLSPFYSREEFCEGLTYLRLCFAKKKETLAEACRRLKKIEKL